MKIETRTVPSKKGDITIYKLINSKGAYVELSSLGAGIISVVVPDKEGKLTDVALGYKDPADYFYDGPCMGKTPGRYAGRIANGRFTINDKTYSLPINNGPNHLHGGPEGFQNQIWNTYECRIKEVWGETFATVTFSLFSPDGDMGYPGNMIAKVVYSWYDDNELLIDLINTCDLPTVANLTNHTYFNLNGEDSGCILNHTLWLKYRNYLPTDENLIPTGEVASVIGTPMNFSSHKKRIGKDIKKDFPALNYGKGYDNCWVTTKGMDRPFLDHVACLEADKSGIVLDVRSSQPGVVIYTGNWLSGSPISKSGRSYNDYDGVAIECQYWPDAPNHPEWEGVGYEHKGKSSNMAFIEFSFSVKEK